MVEAGLSIGVAALPEPDRAWLQAAEQMQAIDSVWQGGHILPTRPTGEVITRLALMSAWTERLRVGASILLLPLYHPVIVAKQLLDLDVHTGGRLAVGVGVGGEFEHEFRAVQVPVEERGARTDEAIHVLRKLWSGERFDHHGRFFELADIQLLPVHLTGARPDSRRAGGPPILISGRKRPAMRRAALLGDGWMPYLLSPRQYGESVTTIRALAQAAGRDLAGFEWMMYVYCAIRRDGDRARSEVAEFLGGAYGAQPDVLDRIAPSGTPEQVARRLQEYVDVGLRHIIFSPAAHEDTLGIIRLAAEEVAPRLRVPL